MRDKCCMVTRPATVQRSPRTESKIALALMIAFISDITHHITNGGDVSDSHLVYRVLLTAMLYEINMIASAERRRRVPRFTAATEGQPAIPKPRKVTFVGHRDTNCAVPSGISVRAMCRKEFLFMNNIRCLVQCIVNRLSFIKTTDEWIVNTDNCGRFMALDYNLFPANRRSRPPRQKDAGALTRSSRGLRIDQ